TKEELEIIGATLASDNISDFIKDLRFYSNGLKDDLQSIVSDYTETTLMDAEDPSEGKKYERFSFEEDDLGNVTIHDIDTGKKVYLTDENATEFLGTLTLDGLDLPGKE